jgi:hypothetical protein
MDWESRLEDRLRAMDDKIDRATVDKPAARPAASMAPVRNASAERGFTYEKRNFAGLFAQDFESFFCADPSEIGQTYAYVINAPHITGNRQYATMASQTRLSVDPDDETINAYATHGSNGNTPEIKILRGAVAFARLCGAMRASSGSGKQAARGNAWRDVGRLLLEQRGSLPPASAKAFVDRHAGATFWQDESLLRRAMSHCAGMLAGIIAHELGHLALGHTLGRAANLEVSRNQEREADSFASSVISTSAFSDPMVEGMILWELAWTWCDAAAGGRTATTHPLAQERLHDFIRANETIAAGLGITLDTLEHLLP